MFSDGYPRSRLACGLLFRCDGGPMRFVDAIRRFWRDRIRGPVLRRYADAVEDLGGVPWRTFSGTERWFLTNDGPEHRPPTLDTESALKILKPSLVDRMREHPKVAWAS